MDRGTAMFWAIVVVLGVASVFLGIGAEGRRGEIQVSKGTIATDAIVRLATVVDGDSVLVQDASGQRISVRLVGVKAFDANAKDDTGLFGQRAADELRLLLDGKEIRVELGEPPRDTYGRTIATLFVGQEDVGLTLIKSGTALAYTAHPFPRLATYLQEQGKARGERRGLWSSAEAIRRADAWARRWGMTP